MKEVDLKIREVAMYIFNSWASALVDMVIYSGSIYILKLYFSIKVSIVISVIIARVISSFLNLALNKNLFTEKDQSLKMVFIIKYYSLWLIFLISSTELIYFIYTRFHLSEISSKLLVDIFLGVFSFFIQKYWIFSKGD